MTDVLSVRVTLQQPAPIRVRLQGPGRIRVQLASIPGPPGPQGPPGDPGGPPGPEGPPGPPGEGAVYSDTPATQITVTAAAAGTIDEAARSDHVHSVGTGTPGSLIVGGSSSAGTAISLARSDHRHGLPAFGSAAGTFAQGDDSRFPTAAQKNALQGTDGSPGNANRFVTDSDTRNTNARTPTPHALSHNDGGSDEIQLTGLSGLAADPQLHEVAKAGTLVSTRKRLNLIEGSNVTLTVADNAGADRTDVTIASTGGGGGGSSFVPANKAMVAAVTTAAFDLACSTPLALTPASDGYVQVLINGVGYQLGDSVRTSDLYFSSDGGTTAKAIAALAAGDLLYIGSGLSFALDATDTLSFLYTA